MPLVEQELLTLPDHLSSTPVFSGVRVTRSLVSYVCFVDRCLPFCPFYFGHCVVCSSSIYGFWLFPLGIFKLFLHYDLFSNVFITVKCRNLCFQSCSFIIPDGLLIIEDSWHIYIWRFEYEILPLWQTRTFFRKTMRTG